MTDLEAVPGVGPGIAKQLEAVFITTAELLAVQSPTDLQQRTKIGPGTAEKIIQAARDLMNMFEFRSGREVETEMASKPMLSTGIASLDQKLWGGIEAGSIVELFGQARAGKTQWCHTFAVMAQLPLEQGGLEGRVLWLDSEKAFKPWILRAMAFRRGLNPDDALDNIGVANIIDSSQIERMIEKIPNLLATQGYRLVIIDSFTGPFRSQFSGLDGLKARQSKLNKLLSKMRRAATATDAIFVYTNQVLATFSQYTQNPNAPSGGHILSHASDYRFNLKLGKKGKKKIALQDNAGIPEFTLELSLNWGGFYENDKEMKKIVPKIVEYLNSRGCDTTQIPDEVEQEDAAQ